MQCVAAGLFLNHESSLVPESDQSPPEPLPSELQTLRRQRHPVSGEEMIFMSDLFSYEQTANTAWSETVKVSDVSGLCHFTKSASAFLWLLYNEIISV